MTVPDAKELELWIAIAPKGVDTTFLHSYYRNMDKIQRILADLQSRVTTLETP